MPLTIYALFSFHLLTGQQYSACRVWRALFTITPHPFHPLRDSTHSPCLLFTTDTATTNVPAPTFRAGRPPDCRLPHQSVTAAVASRDSSQNIGTQPPSQPTPLWCWTSFHALLSNVYVNHFWMSWMTYHVSHGIDSQKRTSCLMYYWKLHML
jgi:hypothetical protein